MALWGPSYSFLFQILWPPCGNALAIAVFIFRLGAVPLAGLGWAGGRGVLYCKRIHLYVPFFAY